MSQIHITDGQTDQILSVITAEHILSNNHHKSLKDTLETFSFETFADMPFSNYLGKLNRVIIPNEDGKYIEFVIFEAGKYRSADGVLITEVYTSASYQLLKKSKIIEPQILPGQTTSQAVAFALYNTEWQPGVITFVGSRTFEIDEHTNPYSFLKRVANEFELELRFRVEIDGNKITGRYVDLVPEIGEWQGREIELGKDLHGIRRIEEAGDVVTALVGLGPVREDGTRLEALVEDNEALQRWGRNGQHLIETYEPESTDEDMTLARLTELTKNELEKRVNAVVEYKCDIADLENVPGMENKKIRFGDTIKIKDAKFKPPLYLEARVHTQERDIVNRAQKTVELGDFIEYTEAEVMSIWQSLQAQIRQKISMSDLREVTYTKPEIDQKDEIVYQDGTVYTDQRSDQVKQEAEQDATDKANRAEDNSKQYTDNVATQVEQNSREFTEQYAEKKVSQSTTPPSSPSFGDLWIDISGDPHIWKRWSGTQWEALERTDLSQFDGQIESGQIADGAVVVDKIAAGTITTDLISTAGLDAGVIKFGTMSGDRIAANSITTNHLNVDSLSSISANLGTVTAGTISGTKIYGTTISGSNFISSGEDEYSSIYMNLDGGNITFAAYRKTDTFIQYSTTVSGNGISYFGSLRYPDFNIDAFSTWFRGEISANSATFRDSVKVSGGVEVAGTGNISESDNGIMFPQNHKIAVFNDNNNFRWYGNREVGVPFEVRSHANFSNYRTDLIVRASDGSVQCPNNYNNTTSNPANLRITEAGTLQRSTSSIKYKKDIVDMPEETYERILQLRPVMYKEKETSEDAKSFWTYPGLIAEEVAEIEPRLVSYRLFGTDDEEMVELETPEPEGVNYERISVYLLPIVKDLRDRVIELEGRLEKFEKTSDI